MRCEIVLFWIDDAIQFNLIPENDIDISFTERILVYSGDIKLKRTDTHTLSIIIENPRLKLPIQGTAQQ